MKAIITRNDQTAILELPTSRMELAGSLNQIGVRTPAHIIPCSDEEEDYIKVKLFGESDFENELTALVTPKDSLGSVNTTLDLYRELPQTQKEKLKAELSQNPPDSLSSLCRKVMDFQPKYVTEDYYFPLTVSVYEYNEYGDLDYDSDCELDGRFANDYADEIKAMFEHPHHPHIRGNIDRFYRRKGEKDPIGFLECKTTSEYNRNWTGDKIPTDYVVQISTYLSILNMDKCKISCLFIPETLRVVAGILYQMKNVFGKLSENTLDDIKSQLYDNTDREMEIYIPMVLSAMGGEFLVPEKLRKETSEAIGDKLIIKDFERDESLEEDILRAADDFWYNNVEKGVPPTLDGEDGESAIATLNKYTPQKKLVTPKMLSLSLIDTIHQMDELKAKKTALNSSVKAIDKEIEKLSVPFVEALAGADIGTVGFDPEEQYEIAYKTGNPSFSVPKKNLEKLKNSYPDAYADCIEERQSKPKLAIKAVKA